MDFKLQPTASNLSIQPRIIIHGGAGNLQPGAVSPEKYALYRKALLTIVSQTQAYMTTAVASKDYGQARYPSALEIATFAVTHLENDPLFNSGHGAVFTRDGLNELEASVMVSHGFAKRGVGVTGLRKVKNPVLLARKMLEHGHSDLLGGSGHPTWYSPAGADGDHGGDGSHPDVPSAQGHTLIHGASAETLAINYGLEMVDPSYYFTQTRWDEHVRALEREKQGHTAGYAPHATATWSADEYLPQGTCGAVAIDATGVICAATSTGGMTNKLTGRIGDTPSVGAGFWAEQWEETAVNRGDADPQSSELNETQWSVWRRRLNSQGPIVELSSSLRRLLADCLPNLSIYQPLSAHTPMRSLTTTRSMGVSGTGNGDSFLRVNAARTVAAIARWGGVPVSRALRQIAGPGGELQMSTGDRWGKAGEGEGGMIGIEAIITRDDITRSLVEYETKIVQDFNCGGMLRAWIGDDGKASMRIWDGEKEKEKELSIKESV